MVCPVVLLCFLQQDKELEPACCMEQKICHVYVGKMELHAHRTLTLTTELHKQILAARDGGQTRDQGLSYINDIPLWHCHHSFVFQYLNLYIAQVLPR